MGGKILKILTALMAVVMIASVAVYFVSGRMDESPVPSSSAEKVFSFAESEYTQKIEAIGTDRTIYLPTDVNGLFYSASLNGEIKYYKYSAGTMTPAENSVTKKTITLNVSYEKIPVTLYIISASSKTVGYGLFTSDMDSSVKVYEYAFVKIAEKPQGYGEGYLLLADFDKSEFYKADKTYSEIFMYSADASSFSTQLSQNTRLVDENGGFRQNWSMMTDEFLQNLGDAKCFMSSRYYTSEETGKRTDIMVYSNAYRPETVAKDILGTWFVNDGKGMHFLRKTDKGFKSVVVADGKEKEVKSFDGDYFALYLRSGNYVVNKKSNEVTNLLDGKSFSIGDPVLTEMTVFSLNEDATKAVFASKGRENSNGTVVQQIVYWSADSTEGVNTYEEPLIFSAESSFVWLEKGKVMSARALTENGKEVGSVIYTF